jgi:hypothetical protein
VTYVNEGWWAPNVKSGQVHDHTANQPATMHRECEPVYTKRSVPSDLTEQTALMELALYVKDLFDGGHFNSRLGRLQAETLDDFLVAALPPEDD